MNSFYFLRLSGLILRLKFICSTELLFSTERTSCFINNLTEKESP